MFAVVTVTGTLATGVSRPTLTPAVSNLSALPSTIRAVAGQTAPTTTNETTTVKIYFAVGDISKPLLRRLAAVHGGVDVLDAIVVGSHHEWGSPPQLHGEPVDCKTFKAEYHKFKESQVVGPWPDKTQSMEIAALRRAGCWP